MKKKSEEEDAIMTASRLIPSSLLFPFLDYICVKNLNYLFKLEVKLQIFFCLFSQNQIT